jgi:hypothetical protein
MNDISDEWDEADNQGATTTLLDDQNLAEVQDKPDMLELVDEVISNMDNTVTPK